MVFRGTGSLVVCTQAVAPRWADGLNAWSAEASGRMELMCTGVGKILGGEHLRGKVKSSGLNMLSFKCLLDA